ncbi:hypothetical protein ACI2LJ_36020 [Streptomyces sp. NPDC088090]|uniref:hypothetical protein n=1 Tax=Streptomyces sp. NPDC088090 TaxID=3365822 RepID=UPI00384EB001
MKATPADSVFGEMYRQEAAVTERLAGAVGPRLLDVIDEEGWIVLVTDYIEGRHPDLTPGSEDVHHVLNAVDALADLLTPCPLADIPPATSNLVLRTAPSHHDVMEGGTLLHCDLRADNLIIANSRVHVIDWGWPGRGAPWLDMAFLLPHLITAGHSAADAQKLGETVSAYRDASPDAVAAFAATLTRFWESRLTEGPQKLRAYRARAVRAGQEWGSHLKSR